MIMQGHTQVWRPWKPSPKMFEHCYSIHRTAPDFHLIGALNDSIHSIEFGDDDDVILAGRMWLPEQDKTWYWQGIHTIVPCWCWAVEVDRDCGKVGYDVKTSFFIMYNFHELGTNIYW